MKLFIKLFFFNPKRDYLPYYKKYTFNYNENKSLFDLLKEISKVDFSFKVPKNQYIKINQKVAYIHNSLKFITSKLGNDLTIEPLLKYRAIDNLDINDSDFFESLNLIKEFLDEELIEYYYLLYPTHYASETFNYINHYRGDAISIIANMAIKKNPKIKYPLLERLFEHSYSIDYCEYVNNTIFKKDYSQDIEELKSIIPSQFKKKESKIESILYSLLSKKIPFKKDDINSKNFAIYYGDISPKRKEEIDKYIDSFNIKRINFSLSQKPIGLSLKDINFNFASFKGAKMLLDAFDSGADILIGVNSSNYIKSIYKYTFKHTKREVKLAIIDLEELEKVLLEYK